MVEVCLDTAAVVVGSDVYRQPAYCRNTSLESDTPDNMAAVAAEDDGREYSAVVEDTVRHVASVVVANVHGQFVGLGIGQDCHQLYPDSSPDIALDYTGWHSLSLHLTTDDCG